MMSGLYPDVHGVFPDRYISPDLTTLPQTLQRAGYRTAGFTTHSVWLSAKTGFDRGFDDFFSADTNGEALNQQIFEWLTRQKDSGKFFLFVHYYDAHSDFDRYPYETGTDLDTRFVPAPPGFQPCDAANRCASQYLASSYEEGFTPPPPDYLSHIIGRYDGGVAYADRAFGALLHALQRDGLDRKLIIAVVSDHGEEFLEHSRFVHAQGYAEVAQIPLIVSFPGMNRAVRVNDTVSLVDVAPTLLAAAGVQPRAEMQGVNLLGGRRGVSTSRVVFTQNGLPNVWPPSDVLFARTADAVVRTEKGHTQNLFLLGSDPLEQHDVLTAHPELIRRLEEQIQEYAVQAAALRIRLNAAAVSNLPPAPADLKRLKSLGYL